MDAAVIGPVTSIVLDAKSNIVFSSGTLGRLMRLNRQTGFIETLAGMGPGVLGEDGPALAASPVQFVNAMPDLHVLGTGEILFGGWRLRKVGLDGRLSVVAGTGINLSSPEGTSATDVGGAFLGFDLDSQGNIYYSDYGVVHRIDAQGIVHRFSGLVSDDASLCNPSGDGGLAVNAPLCQPHDVATDTGGSVFIADTNNNRIRRVDAKTGIITTVAGSGPGNGQENYGKGSFCGDGGQATQACLNSPKSVGVDSQGEIFIMDSQRIRKVERSGVISTVFQGSLDGTAFMTFDASNNVYLPLGGGIVRISPSGSAQLLAGNGPMGFSGDGGLATSALTNPSGGGVGIDAEGNLYFVDGENRRIRAVRYGAVLAPANARAEIRGGTPQSSPLSTAFATPLTVAVLDGTGQPAPNVRVDFDAPATGASCLQPHFFAITGRDGVAKATCTANSTPGTFTVTATPMATMISLRFTLINTPPALVSNSVANGASFGNGAIAPGEIVTVFGAGVGPAQLVRSSNFATDLASARVRFNDTAAPLIFARYDQVAAVVPYALDGATSAQVTLEFSGNTSNAITVPVAAASPGLFTVDSSGRGQGAILNQDTTLNSAANPAALGSVVVLYATGGGQTDPPGVDGTLATAPYPKLKLPVTVTMGGQLATIEYAGAAPGLVAGVIQVNARVPPGITPDNSVPVVLKVGEFSSPAQVTVAIR
ncbi:MAG: hypothetical protein HY236_09290 [Acidobacteria bacterium]|nr:hypothetical protein [Acidobacteriota bacterium]